MRIQAGKSRQMANPAAEVVHGILEKDRKHSLLAVPFLFFFA